MKFKAIVLIVVLALLVSGTAFAAKPVIKSDRSYFDINTGLYVLSGNVIIKVNNRTITAGQAKVSMASLEVWGSGGITVTQGDMYFSGENVYVYGSDERAKIDGGIYFKRSDLTVTADRAEYNWDTKIAVFDGNVQINQNGNATCTEKATYNLRTNCFQ